MTSDYPIRFPAQLRQHLRAQRKKRGWTQAQLGARLGVSQARIAEIEANPGLVSLEQIMQILAALDVTMVLSEAPAPGSLDAPIHKSQQNDAGQPSRAETPSSSPGLNEDDKSVSTTLHEARHQHIDYQNGTFKQALAALNARTEFKSAADIIKQQLHTVNALDKYKELLKADDARIRQHDVINALEKYAASHKTANEIAKALEQFNRLKKKGSW